MNWSTNCFAPYHQFRTSILQDSAKTQIMTKFVLNVIATISKMFHFCKSVQENYREIAVRPNKLLLMLAV